MTCCVTFIAYTSDGMREDPNGPSAPRASRLPSPGMWRTLTATLVLALLTACSSGNNGPEAVGEAASQQVQVTAAEVTAAIEAAGLPVLNPRDNSANCGTGAQDLPCTELLTTDLYSVTVWNTPDDARHAIDVAVADKPIRAGQTTTIAFHEDGTTPAYDRAAYEQAVAQLP